MTGGPLDPLRGMTPARRAGGIWACLALAGIGMLLAGATACTDLAVKPARPGTPGHLAYIAALVLPVALALGVMAGLSHRRQVADPRSWGETWRELKIAALVGPPWLGFLLVGHLFGLGTAALTASSFFLAGLFVLRKALHPVHRHTLGWAVSTLLAGCNCLLVGNYETAGFIAGGWLAAGGLSTVALLALQPARVASDPGT